MYNSRSSERKNAKLEEKKTVGKKKGAFPEIKGTGGMVGGLKWREKI